MLGLSDTIDQLAMANSVCFYSNVLRREDESDWLHLIRMAIIVIVVSN